MQFLEFSMQSLQTLGTRDPGLVVCVAVVNVNVSVNNLLSTIYLPSGVRVYPRVVHRGRRVETCLGIMIQY